MMFINNNKFFNFIFFLRISEAFFLDIPFSEVIKFFLVISSFIGCFRFLENLTSLLVIIPTTLLLLSTTGKPEILNFFFNSINQTT